jgi:hypothetical protein
MCLGKMKYSDSKQNLVFLLVRFCDSICWTLGCEGRGNWIQVLGLTYRGRMDRKCMDCVWHSCGKVVWLQGAAMCMNKTGWERNKQRELRRPERNRLYGGDCSTNCMEVTVVPTVWRWLCSTVVGRRNYVNHKVAKLSQRLLVYLRVDTSRLEIVTL